MHHRISRLKVKKYKSDLAGVSDLVKVVTKTKQLTISKEIHALKFILDVWPVIAA